MKSKIKVGIIVFLMMILGICIKSNAAITAESKEVKSEEQFTISITSDISLGAYSVKAESYSGLTLVTSTGGTGEGTATISNALTSGGTTNLAKFTFKAPAVTKDTKYTIKFTATGMGDENLNSLDPSSATAAITVKAPVVEPPKDPEPTTPTTPTTPPPAETPKSTEARLSNFGIRPNDFSGFKKDKYEYSTTVPNEVEKVTIYADKAHDKATVEGAGEVTLKEGKNSFEIKVTAEDGKTTKTYKLTITRRTAAEEEAVNGEARLKSLGIKPKEYDFEGFDSEKTEYSVEVPNEVEEIEVYATAMNSNAQITGTGMITLEEGVNKLEISVISVNGTRKTYMLEVTRKKEEAATGTTDAADEDIFGLKSLSITGLKLKENFKPSIYKYTIDITEDLKELEINAISSDKDATVQIIGNENLKEGENVITIMVENEETEDVATYQIIVNKNLTAPEEVVAKTSWLKPSTWGKEEIIKLVIMIVLVILILIAIWLKIKIAEGNEPERDLPGAEELDRAIAEHQELASEEMYYESEQVEVPNMEEIRPNYIEEIAKGQNIYEEEVDAIRQIRKKGKHF